MIVALVESYVVMSLFARIETLLGTTEEGRTSVGFHHSTGVRLSAHFVFGHVLTQSRDGLVHFGRKVTVDGDQWWGIGRGSLRLAGTLGAWLSAPWPKAVTAEGRRPRLVANNKKEGIVTSYSQNSAEMQHLIRAGEAQAAATLTALVLGTIKSADTIPDVILAYKEVYRAMFGREP